MSIASELNKLSVNIENAYSAIKAKGGTLPENKSASNLSSTIDNIPSGGSKYGTPIGGVLGDVDENGVLQPASEEFDFVGEGIKEIPETLFVYKFYKNGAIKSVSFPDLTMLGDQGLASAFQDCTSLTSVSFPSLIDASNLCSFQNVFSGCSNLVSVDFPLLNKTGGYSMANAFQDCTSLTSVSFPSLIDAGNRYSFQNVFSGCSNLVSVDFPLLNKIGRYALSNAFQDCTSLTSVSFPNLLSGTVDFLRGTSITEINLPRFEHATAVNFSNCTSLTSVSFPSLIDASTIYSFQNVFSGCSNLVSVDFPVLNKLGGYGMTYAFQDCTSLTSVSFPSLMTINANGFGTSTFFGCTSLTEIHFKADAQTRIEKVTGYSSKFGATNATIYFDL